MAEQELEEPREEELQIDLGNLLAYDSRRLTSSLFDEQYVLMFTLRLFLLIHGIGTEYDILHQIYV